VSHSNSMMPHRTRGRIRAFCALAAIVAGAGAAAPAQAAPTATDWTSVGGNIATGTVQAVGVDLRATTSSGRVWDPPTSRVDGSWPYFAGPTFAPSLAKSDVIQISGAPGAEYTISFRNGAGNPVTVKDPVLHLGSLGSTLKFTTGAPTQLTSENNFRVVGSQVIGDASNTIRPSGNSDSSGSIKFTGPYARITFTATPNYTGPEDGVLVQLVTQPGDPGTPPPPPPQCANAETPITQANLAAAEDAIACLTNLERNKAGLAPLTANATLRGTARAHSRDMVQRRFFSHTNPEGKGYCDRIRAAGYPAGLCRENIAWDSAATPNKIMYDPQNGWMTHPPGQDGHNWHRETILDPQLKELGVGVVAGNHRQGPGGQGATVTQNFGSPA
jgi:uncharacterized protein YkwD